MYFKKLILEYKDTHIINEDYHQLNVWPLMKFMIMARQKCILSFIFEPILRNNVDIKHLVFLIELHTSLDILIQNITQWNAKL